MELCAKCRLREVEYVNEGGMCELCWIDWWVDGMKIENPHEKAKYRREVRADLRKKRKRKGQATQNKAG